MRPADLADCIEKAFEGLHPPSFEEMTGGFSVEEDFLCAVESRTWQELRPLQQYLGDGGQFVILSAKAYQYYLPAFLYALIDKAGDELYLPCVLDSLWYEDRRVPKEGVRPFFYIPRGGWEELMPEVEKQMPHLTYEERKFVAKRRVSIAEGMAKVTEMTGRDWSDRSHLRKRWEQRMSILTDQQKHCIAQVLANILERTTNNPSDAGRIQSMLDKYWGVFLPKPEER
jgi:hypothetical protein